MGNNKNKLTENFSFLHKKDDATACHSTKKLHYHKDPFHLNKTSISKMPNLKEKIPK